MMRYVCKALLPVLLLACVAAGEEAVVAPSQDGSIVTFGGGEGNNAYLKFDISSVPTGVTVDSVILRVTVSSQTADWDGDMTYCNVHSQTWDEAGDAASLWEAQTSDSVHQESGFSGSAWEQIRSVDLSGVFAADYEAGNTYCTIRLKDPDDMTFMPPPGATITNSPHSLAVGDDLFDQSVRVYPREHPNATPWLSIFYTMPPSRVTVGELRVREPHAAAGMGALDLRGRVVRRVLFNPTEQELSPGVLVITNESLGSTARVLRPLR
jgi:hypothetical protein